MRATCRRCRRALRGREYAYYCVNHRAVVCEFCAEDCEKEGHELMPGKINNFGEFVLHGRGR
jgi:hypothetical protein